MVNSISPRLPEPVLCLTKRYKLKIVQVYAPTTSYSDDDINNFDNDIDDTFGKRKHYTIVTGDFNAQIGKRTNTVETATGIFGFGLRNERENLGRMGNIKKVKNHEYHVPEESKEEMDVEKPKRCNEDRNWLTNRPGIVTDVTVINQVNIGCDHIMVMNNIKLDVEVERKTLMTKRPPRVDATRIG